jgi:hypothetical protein
MAAVGTKEIRILKLLDRERATERVKQAFLDGACSKTSAASLLGVHRDLYSAWIKELDLVEWTQVAIRIARRDGWFYSTIGGEAWKKRFLEQRAKRESPAQKSRRSA